MKLLIICIISACCLLTVGRPAIHAAPDGGLSKGSSLGPAGDDVGEGERDFQGHEYLGDFDFDSDGTDSILTDYESGENIGYEDGPSGDS